MKPTRPLDRIVASLLALCALALSACGPGRVPPSDEGGERLVIDVRAPAAFAAGHHAGALNIQLGWDQLAQRTPSYVPYAQTPLALHAAGPGQAAEAYEVLRRLGYQDVVVVGPPRRPATSALLWAEELRAQVEGPAPPVVLDVREPEEHAQGVVPGALLVDPDRGPDVVAHFDRSLHYAVICAGGWRSSQLQSWMEREGFLRVENVIDGMSAWVELPDAPLERD